MLLVASDRKTSRPTTTTSPPTAAPTPSRRTVCRRSVDSPIAAAAHANAVNARSGASSLIARTERAAVALTSPRSRRTTSTRRVVSIRRASAGRTACSPAATTVPTSASVNVSVRWSRANTARWTSRTPARNRPVKARAPTADDTTDATSGRAASRSSCCSSSWSVTRAAISERTLSSPNATVARFGELVGVHRRPAHVAGHERQHQRHDGEHHQRADRHPPTADRRGTGSRRHPLHGRATVVLSPWGAHSSPGSAAGRSGRAPCESSSRR